MRIDPSVYCYQLLLLNSSIFLYLILKFLKCCDWGPCGDHFVCSYYVDRSTSFLLLVLISRILISYSGFSGQNAPQKTLFLIHFTQSLIWSIYLIL